MMTMTFPVSRQRSLPHSLTHPMGITFLPPDQRVSTAELERRDAQWRALREAAYARAWAEDATLVGSSRGFGMMPGITASASRETNDDGRSNYSYHHHHHHHRSAAAAWRSSRRRRKAILKLLRWMEGRSAADQQREQQQQQQQQRQNTQDDAWYEEEERTPATNSRQLPPRQQQRRARNDNVEPSSGVSRNTLRS